METITEAPDESTGDSSIVKSEDGNAQQDGGRNSPPPNCAICLGRCRNKSFTDSCLHQFCFKCLLTWSRVKTECPLCKQNFKSIIHNVKSNHQYEEYPVEQPQPPVLDRAPSGLNIDEIVNAARRFRYRTTLTLPRRETLAIQQFLMQYPLASLVNDLPPRQLAHPSGSASFRHRSRHSPAEFRRTVYRHNLWARPLPDFTGRFRDCSPEFFRYNDSQIHRLMIWLNRELNYLLNENSGHITYVIGRIMELLPQHYITSVEFHNAMHCYFGERTAHFLHEFHCFASTPYDITGYDRHVQYQTDARISAVVDEVLSSSDSDRDSDIVLVSSSHPATTPASSAPPPAPSSAPGPSHAPDSSHPPYPAPMHESGPRYPRGRLPQSDVVPIETISHFDSDSDSSEVMVVGYIKPPHQRTPELVDLLGSDSDVVVQESTPMPMPAPAPAPAPTAQRVASPPLVRLRLSRKRLRRPLSIEAHAGSETDDASYTPPSPPPPPRRRRLTRDRPMVLSPPLPPTPSPPLPPLPPTPSPPPTTSPPTTPPLSQATQPPINTPTPTSTIPSSRTVSPACNPSSVPAVATHADSSYGAVISNFSTDGDVSTDEYSLEYDAGRRKKTHRKSAKAKLKSERSSRRRRDRKKTEDKRPKRESRHLSKSKNGKGVKSSKNIVTDLPPAVKVLDQSGPSGITHCQNKRSAAEVPRRACRESKRLKSVVSVMKRDSSVDTQLSAESSKCQRNGRTSDGSARLLSTRYDSDSSSDDNIPLQVTLNRLEDKNRAIE